VKLALISCLCILVSGCMMYTKVELDPKWDRHAKYSFEDYFDYYLFGFVGNPTLNLQKICVDQKPYGFVRVQSAEDVVFELMTLGIYSPRTVRVWCGD
jgi:hypothetical protein